MTALVGDALTRLARLTSIVRTRVEDADRFDRHDGTSADVIARLDATARRLEDLASRLESKLD